MFLGVDYNLKYHSEVTMPRGVYQRKSILAENVKQNRKNKLFAKQERAKSKEERAKAEELDGRTKIENHEGKKYLRTITSVDGMEDIQVDVYCVLAAFNVTCPATAHAIKKLLCGGQRSKGDLVADLKGVLAAVNRAIDLAEIGY
jgi:hypothetical protein